MTLLTDRLQKDFILTGEQQALKADEALLNQTNRENVHKICSPQALHPVALEIYWFLLLPVWWSSPRVWSGCVHNTLVPSGFCSIRLKDLYKQQKLSTTLCCNKSATTSGHQLNARATYPWCSASKREPAAARPGRTVSPHPECHL